MHMPPWMDFDSKIPILCDEFRIRIELSGKGHAERTPRVMAATAYCALFKNILIFCQATFVAEDETAPHIPSDANSLGFVFLQNLGTQALNQKPSQERRRASNASVSFILNLDTSDSLTFMPPFHAVSQSQKWYDCLQACLSQSSGVQDTNDAAFVQVILFNI